MAIPAMKGKRVHSLPSSPHRLRNVINDFVRSSEVIKREVYFDNNFYSAIIFCESFGKI